MFDFKDKVVLVTGGSRGLGKAMSEGFADVGAKVVIASRKLEANLIKRIADSEEILNPIFYLAGESYTTGITLTADGGFMAR